MTRDEGVALIKQQLAFRTTLDTEIVTLMKLAQTTLEKGPTKAWFLLSDPTPLVTVANQRTVVLPDGWLAEDEDKPVYWQRLDGSRKKLIRDEYEILNWDFKD